MRRRLVFLPCAIGVLASGCAGEGGADPAALRHDSAGVEIVENPAARAAGLLTWTVDSVPAVSIGTAQGDEEYQLFRVNGAARLADGRIAIVNAGSQELRFFDARGTFLKRVGGQGEGPGEFEFPQLVPAATFDTLRVWDMGLGRLTSYDAGGELLDMQMPGTSVREPLGMLSGRLLTGAGSARADRGTPEGMMRNDMTYIAVDPVTSTQDTIFEAEGIALLLARYGGSFFFRAVPFDGAPSVAVGNDAIHVASGERAELRVLDGEGTVRRIVRILREPEPVSDADFDRVVEGLVAQANTEEIAIEMRRWYGMMPRPETAPVFQKLLLDDTGHLWLEEFRATEEEPSWWVVLDPAGTALGRIELPRDLEVAQIGRDFILGVQRDTSDVEYVVQYGLTR